MDCIKLNSLTIVNYIPGEKIPCKNLLLSHLKAAGKTKVSTFIIRKRWNLMCLWRCWILLLHYNIFCHLTFFFSCHLPDFTVRLNSLYSLTGTWMQAERLPEELSVDVSVKTHVFSWSGEAEGLATRRNGRRGQSSASSSHPAKMGSPCFLLCFSALGGWPCSLVKQKPFFFFFLG